MEERINAALNSDSFDLRFRRQGWLTFSYMRPGESDPQLLSQRWQASMKRSYDQFAFFDLFGDNTFRKLLGYIYTHSPCTRDDLKRICGNDATLDEYLNFMEDQELAEREGQGWRKASRFAHVDNIGRTLEWWVAEWFKWVLQSPARYGVHVDDLSDGGDLDVVAFVNDLRIWVECKSGREVGEDDFRNFLRRQEEFAPDLAILLIDTDTKIDQHIEVLNRVCTSGDPFTARGSQSGVYWGARRCYVVNTKKSIAHSLEAALRLYYADIRHLSFWS